MLACYYDVDLNEHLSFILYNLINKFCENAWISEYPSEQE